MYASNAALHVLFFLFNFITFVLECKHRKADSTDLKSVFLPKVDMILTALSVFYLQNRVQVLITKALRAQSGHVNFVTTFFVQDPTFYTQYTKWL